MKILFISKLYRPHIGGVERHVAEISGILGKRGNEITVLTEKYKGSLKKKEIGNGIKIIRFSYPHIKFLGLLCIWVWLFRNRQIIKENDIVHCHDVFIWYLPFKFIFPRKPVYTTFHGYEGYPIRRAFIIIRKISAKLSLGNICIGKFIEKWYGIKADYISYGAVDTLKFKPRKIKPKYDAVFVGRVDEQTGINQYMKIKKNILVISDKPNPEDYYPLGKFIFVSRYLSILEAFACQKPVIALYDNPLKKDYLSMTPFNSWIEICSDPNKISYNISKSKLDTALKWAQTQTWDKMADIYLKLWKA